jgi:hypothetical protein
MYGDAGLREGTKFGPHMTEPRSFNARHPVQRHYVCTLFTVRTLCYDFTCPCQKESKQNDTRKYTLYWSCSAST